MTDAALVGCWSHASREFCDALICVSKEFIFERIKSINPADPAKIDVQMPWDENVQTSLRS